MARLGISRQTLYAYVSRGLLRASAGPRRPAPQPLRRARRRRPAGAAAARPRAQGGRRLHASTGASPCCPPASPGSPMAGSSIAARMPSRLPNTRRWRRSPPCSGRRRHAGTARSPRLPCRASGRPIERCLRAAADLVGTGMWAREPAAAAPRRLPAPRRIAEAAAGGSGAGAIHEIFARGLGLCAAAGADLLRRALVLIGRP